VSVKELLSIVRSLNHKKDIPIELPYWAASLIAPAAEKISNLSGDRNPVLTPYSIYTLQTNGLFSHQKAEREFGYHPKELIDTIRDTLES
jgi:dihydroflavonol-4-reductase